MAQAYTPKYPLLERSVASSDQYTVFTNGGHAGKNWCLVMKARRWRTESFHLQFLFILLSIAPAFILKKNSSN